MIAFRSWAFPGGIRQGVREKYILKVEFSTSYIPPFVAKPKSGAQGT